MGNIEGLQKFHVLKLVEVDGKVSIVADCAVESCLREGETVQHSVEDALKEAAMADGTELHKLIDPEKITLESHIIAGT